MRILKNLRIDEVSCVLKGANQGAQVLIRKNDDGPLMFNDIMLAKAADDDPDDNKVSAKLNAMVDAMIAAAPSLDRQAAAHYLLHDAHGRRLAEHLNNLSKGETIMPQVDILKIATILEDGLNAQVTKRDGESFAHAFSRRYETDVDFRKSWATVTEAKQLVGLSKGMASLTPTSTEVGNTNVSDDSAEAVRLLQEMAAKNGRSFESVFSDPANAKLASRTYTANHRSSVSMDYLEQ
jgi:hypothetical protein